MLSTSLYISKLQFARSLKLPAIIMRMYRDFNASFVSASVKCAYMQQQQHRVIVHYKRVAVSRRKSRLYRGVIKTYILLLPPNFPPRCRLRLQKRTRTTPTGRNLPLTTFIREIYCAAVQPLYNDQKKIFLPRLRAHEKVNATSAYATIFVIVYSTTLTE